MTQDFDLVIRGGTVIDGSGSDAIAGDVAIVNGRIAAVGRFAGHGREEIDAEGRLVTPGFVDVHSHYDGQVTWEHTLRPSSNHGVTTALLGNCGVGFAPCRAGQRDLLVSVMEGVEDIPEIVMTKGIPWNWETFPEYLNSLAQREYDIDFGVQVPHAPVRIYAMGKRGADREPATAEDMALMSRIVQEGVAAGAFGFSTSRTLLHRTSRGVLAPTVTHGEEELRSIALGLKSIGKGVLQLTDDFGDTGPDGATEFQLLRRIAAECGRPIAFSLVELFWVPKTWRLLLDQLGQANREGLTIRGQVFTRPMGYLFGLDVSYNPFSMNPSYQPIKHLSVRERAAALHAPELRAKLLAEKPMEGFSAHTIRVARAVEQMFVLGDPPNYAPPPTAWVGAIAQRRGVSPLEAAYDLLLENDGYQFLFSPIGNYFEGNLDNAYTMMTHPNTVVALGDGGAHYGMLCDASYPTFMLTYWTRDRHDGNRKTLSLPFVVEALARKPALSIGLNDRGLLAPGYRGDVNVIDYDRLALQAPRAVYDLPAGGRRLTQRADGYVATIKSGQVIYRDGQATGALPGRLVRGAQEARRIS